MQYQIIWQNAVSEQTLFGNGKLICNKAANVLYKRIDEVFR